MPLIAFIVALVGGFIGGLLASGVGFLFGLITGYCVGAIIHLLRRVSELERRLSQTALPPTEMLSPSPLPAPTIAVEPEEKAAPAEQPVTSVVSERTMESQGVTPVNVTTPAVDSFSPQTRATDSVQQETLFDKLLTRIKSFFTDGNVVVKIGLLVLFVGVGFLLKYAASHAMFPVELRIAGIGVGGILLVSFGWHLRVRKRIYALLLQGGGVGVMYLTVFGAAKLYHLLPLGLAFGVMVGLVILSGVLAVLQNAKYLAFYGAAGGFLAPILTSTGSGNHVMLFSYYALLNLGIVGIAWYRAWRELNLLGFAFTFVIGTLWGARYYQPAYFNSVEPFLILFFIFFVIIAVLFAFRQPPQLRGYVDSTLVFGVPIIAFALQAALVKDMHYGLAFSALGMSGFYILLASSLWSLGPQGMRLLTEAFLAMGVVFGSLAIPLALDARWTSAVWALEGAAIVWVGVRQQRILARLFGLLLQAGAGFFFLQALDLLVRDIPVLNGLFVGAVIVSLAGLFSSYYLYRYRAHLREWERSLHLPLLIWGVCWWFGSGVHEIHEFVDPRQLAINVLLAYISVSLFVAYYLQVKLDWPMLRYPVLGQVYVIGIVLWFGIMTHIVNPLAWYGWLCWPLAFVMLYRFLYAYRDNVRVTIQQWQHMLGLWLLVVFLTWEAVWLIDHGVEGQTWRESMYGLAPGLIMFILITQGRRVRWPIAQHSIWYVGYAAIPIMFMLGLYALGMGMLHQGNPWPIRYLPIINPVDVVVGFILYLLILWRHDIRLRMPELQKLIDPRGLGIAIAVCAFLWLNGIIARTVHYWFAVPHKLSALIRSPIFEASVSVAWTLTAMMVMYLASRRRRRETWFVGLGLFLVTVAKLFLVDIADENELTMIISLIVVAIVAIVFGYYLSPLPPKRGESRP